uniref:Uncharacterized protein n=1 Tax=Anguilla anguilla TaxID=7936 RepID=A0A0E9SJF5_ANGAN
MISLEDFTLGATRTFFLNLLNSG